MAGWLYIAKDVIEERNEQIHCMLKYAYDNVTVGLEDTKSYIESNKLFFGGSEEYVANTVERLEDLNNIAQFCKIPIK
jgi:xylose isomerase